MFLGVMNWLIEAECGAAARTASLSQPPLAVACSWAFAAESTRDRPAPLRKTTESRRARLASARVEKASAKRNRVISGTSGNSVARASTVARFAVRRDLTLAPPLDLVACSRISCL